MSWYRENKDEWKQIIETVAAEERRTTQMVEKDTIQSMFLLGLSRGEIPFVFKGGIFFFRNREFCPVLHCHGKAPESVIP